MISEPSYTPTLHHPHPTRPTQTKPIWRVGLSEPEQIHSSKFFFGGVTTILYKTVHMCCLSALEFTQGEIQKEKKKKHAEMAKQGMLLKIQTSFYK